jgi:hypothetical protein
MTLIFEKNAFFLLKNCQKLQKIVIITLTPDQRLAPLKGHFLGQQPLVPLLFLSLLFFYYSFLVHQPVNRDDRRLLAHAMASDFSVTWQCPSKRTISFFVTDQTTHPQRPFFENRFCPSVNFLAYVGTLKILTLECFASTNFFKSWPLVPRCLVDFEISKRQNQGCQIVLSSTYQSRKKVPNNQHMYLLNGRKIYQMAVK